MIREYIESIPGGRHWSMTVRKGVALELTDLSGGSNVGMLIYNAENTTERLNLPDSLKCQHTFKITLGNCLYTDMGRILCSVIDGGTMRPVARVLRPCWQPSLGQKTIIKRR